jgi:hypothetical protein
VNRKKDSTGRNRTEREYAEFYGMFREERMDKDFAEIGGNFAARRASNAAKAA